MSTATNTTPSAPSAWLTHERKRARRRTWTVCALAVLTMALFLVRALLGDFTVAFPDAIRMIQGQTIDVPGANYIFMESKLPRAVAALLGGALFGAAGAAMQSLVRNPLASPDVLGISLGSSTFAVFAVVVLGLSGVPILLAAVLGGAFASGVILLLSRGQTARMVIVGIALAAGLQSVIQWILLKSNAFQAQDAMVWLAGSLNDVDWGGITRLALGGIPLLLALSLLSHRLRVLELGRPLAIGLGIADGRVRAWTFVAIVLAVALATSVCGPVAFVALLAGPIVRRLVGRTDLLAAALVGASITLAGDYIGAYLIPGGTKLPVGVITGLAGAPVLAWLLMSSRKKTA